MTDSQIVLQPKNDFLVPAASLDEVLATYQRKKEFIERVLRPDVDFGVTPGTDKPSLKKPGAEKMASFFGLSPVFEDIACVEDWTGKDHDGESFFYYRQKCRLYRGDKLIASADGSCNSWEKKYRYRNAERVCPNCGKATVFKSKPRPGDAPNKPQGFYCWNKKGGCGATFRPDDPSIVNQENGQVKNPDIAEQVNTVLKMAQKRALVAAVLIATNASDYFTQDMDDFISGDIVDAVIVGSNRPESSTNDATPKDAPAETRAEPTRPDPAPSASDDDEEIDPMGAWAVEYAALQWNIKKGEAAVSIASKKLQRLTKREFKTIVNGV